MSDLPHAAAAVCRFHSASTLVLLFHAKEQRFTRPGSRRRLTAVAHPRGTHAELDATKRSTASFIGHGGFVAAGFDEVRNEFERNFAERGEIGAAVAAYWRGEKVVDLWGGRRTVSGRAPWNEDTMVVVNSTTKGLAAMPVAVANSRGWIDYDARVADYWPEFAQNGKFDR